MIREARISDCGLVSRKLRHEHRALWGDRNVHRSLRQALEASAIRAAWIEDGKLMAIGGIMGFASSIEGTPWLAATDEAVKRPIVLVRHVQRVIARALQTYRRLATTVFRHDDAALQLAYFLGFKATETVTIDGIEAVVMVLEK